MGTEGQDSAGEHIHREVHDTLPISDDVLVKVVLEAARLVLQERPTVEQVSALATTIEEAAAAGASIEEAVASLALFPRLEAFAKNNPAFYAAAEKAFIVLLTALCSWAVMTAVRPGETAPPPQDNVPIERRIEQPPMDEKLRQMAEDAIREAEQEPPEDEQQPRD